MAKIDARVLQKLQDKLGYSKVYVYRLIQDHANEAILPRDLAAISLAMANGINVQRIASQQQISVIRGAKSGQQNAAPISVAVAQPSRARNKAATNRNTSTKTKAKPASVKNVFVIHGRDEKARKAVFSLLRNLHLTPLEWSTLVAKTKKGAPYVGEILDTAFKEAGAVVVLLTPDDMAMLREELQRPSDAAVEKKLTGQARPNVLFEAGMAFGKMPDKTIIVQVGKIKPFSDVVGRHYVSLSNKVESKIDLANRLKSAGCAAETTGTDWQGHDAALDATNAKKASASRATRKKR